jgi:thioredoxin-like negative regulator of GroEL
MTDSENNLLAQAMEWHKAGDVAAAEKAYLQLIEDEPDNSNLMYTLATLYLGNGQLDEAQQWINKPLQKPVLRDVPWWRAGRFKEGHWKNYSAHLSEENSTAAPA